MKTILFIFLLIVATTTTLATNVRVAEPTTTTTENDKVEETTQPEIVNKPPTEKVKDDLFVGKNNQVHKTTLYKDQQYLKAPANVAFPKLGASRLIVRRGTKFTVQSSDTIKIALNPCGVLKEMMKNDDGKCGVKEAVDVTSSWRIKSKDDQTHEITPPANAAVGVYTLNGKYEFIVLFNSFKSGSTVYQKKSAYVMETKSMIYQGLSDDHEGHIWNVDQFRGLNLIVALRLLRQLTMEQRQQAHVVARHLTMAIGKDVCYGKWGDGSYTTGQPRGGYACTSDKKPSWFSRSKKKGPWYSKCHDPSKYTGTSELFEYHYGLLQAGQSTKIQYCQCFVYAGVTATIGRTLGIPTRIITTFQSAHDTNGDRSISKFYEINEKGVYEAINNPNRNHGVGHSDSIWSFHVWNEMYMQRPDLPKKRRGRRRYTIRDWNAVDSTPQEKSHGVYQMGPAPVATYLKKNKDGCYDSQFVISEVNADVTLYVRKKGTQDEFKQQGMPYETDPFDDALATVGCIITTSKPGCDFAKDDASDNCKEDVTTQYKMPEPSRPGKPSKSSKICIDIKTGEKKPLVPSSDVASSFLEAKVATDIMAPMKLVRKDSKDKDVVFNVHFPNGRMKINSTSMVTVTVKNTNPTEKRTISLVGVAYGIDYNGQRIVYKKLRSRTVYAKIAYKSEDSKALKPGEEFKFKLPVPLNPREMEMIGIEGTKTKNIEISLSGNVEETKMIFMKEKRKRIDGDVEEL